MATVLLTVRGISNLLALGLCSSGQPAALVGGIPSVLVIFVRNNIYSSIIHRSTCTVLGRTPRQPPTPTWATRALSAATQRREQQQHGSSSAVTSANACPVVAPPLSFVVNIKSQLTPMQLTTTKVFNYLRHPAANGSPGLSSVLGTATQTLLPATAIGSSQCVAV